VDVVGTYFFIYKWGMGTEGAALAQIAVKSCRLLVWLGLIFYYGLFDTICVQKKSKSKSKEGVGVGVYESIFSWKEFTLFITLSLPAILSNFSGWFIFELQIMCLANIQGKCGTRWYNGVVQVVWYKRVVRCGAFIFTHLVTVAEDFIISLFRDMTCYGTCCGMWYICMVGISPAGLAAGAIWVQSESTLASIQSGWLATTSMRSLKLLGNKMRDS
jgi:hypothetical protein